MNLRKTKININENGEEELSNLQYRFLTKKIGDKHLVANVGTGSIVGEILEADGLFTIPTGENYRILDVAVSNLITNVGRV